MNLANRCTFYLALFIASFLFFAVFAPMGNLPSDTEYSVATAKSLVLHGTLAIAPDPGLHDLKIGVNGKRYSKYGTGYALLLVPLVGFSELAGRCAPAHAAYIQQFVLSFTDTFFGAIIILLFFTIFSSLGYAKKVSLISTAFIACGSILLPYSKIVHSEIPSTLLLLVFFAVIARKPVLDLKNGVVLGLTMAALIFIKAGNAPFVVVMAACALWLLYKKRGTAAGVIALAAACLVFGGILLGLNAARFGSPFNAGYGAEQDLFTTPLWAGLFGLLFSPSKSLFLFSPLVIACIIALPRLNKKNRLFTVLMLYMAILSLLFYAKWHDWHGGWCWGPRLIVPVILLLHLALPEFLLLLRGSRWRRALLTVLMVCAAGINLLGSLVWYQQVCHFHRDYSSITYSEPAAAARLLANKLRNKPEIYSCADFGLDCKRNDYAAIFHVAVRNDSLDFSSFEKFQGLATMWDGVRRNFHVPFLWTIPLVFLFLSSFLFFRLLRAASFFPPKK